MKKAVVIGALGHVGSYLTPRLVEAGYEVTAISRGNQKAYTSDWPQWKQVRHIQADRRAMAADGTFGQMIAELKPDVVCDLIAYKPYEITDLTDALTRMQTPPHLLQVGSIWVYKEKLWTPVTEGHPHTDGSEYGSNKAIIERHLMDLSQQGRIPCTVIHPGHICGQGWLPINPQGNLNPQVYADIRAGRPIMLPDDGQATLHHVHSDDIAGLHLACLKKPEKSQGQVFHAVSPYAMTLYGMAKGMYEAYGYECAVEYVPWEKFKTKVSKEDADITWDHISRCPSCSMRKAEDLLGFVPRYTTMDILLSCSNLD